MRSKLATLIASSPLTTHTNGGEVARNKTTPFIKTIRNGRFTITYGQINVGKNVFPFAGAACLHESEPDLHAVGREFSEARALAYVAEEIKHKANKRMKKAHKLLKDDFDTRAYKKLMKEKDAEKYKDLRKQNETKNSQRKNGSSSVVNSTTAFITESEANQSIRTEFQDKPSKTDTIDAALSLLDNVIASGNFTMEELAKAIGVSRRTLHRYQAKTTKPSVQTAYKIIDYLNNW